MSHQWDTLSWFQALLFLLSAACLAEKQHIYANFIFFGLTRPGLESTLYRTRCQHANQYTNNAIQWQEEKGQKDKQWSAKH